MGSNTVLNFHFTINPIIYLYVGWSAVWLVSLSSFAKKAGKPIEMSIRTWHKSKICKCCSNYLFNFMNFNTVYIVFSLFDDVVKAGVSPKTGLFKERVGAVTQSFTLTLSVRWLVCFLVGKFAIICLKSREVTLMW